MNAVTIPCGICPGDIALGAVACPGCARPVDDRDRAVLQLRLEGANHAAYGRGKNVRGASKWIGVLALLFAVSAPLMFAMQAMETDKAIEHLKQFEDDDVLKPIGGKTYTAGELRRKVKSEPVRALVGGLILAGLMAVLWVWSRRAPLPAIGCALALFVVVQVASFMVDPTSIAKGIIVKILAVGALGRGLRAALAARADMRRPTA
jgi:hypothetical protein